MGDKVVEHNRNDRRFGVEFSSGRDFFCVSGLGLIEAGGFEGWVIIVSVTAQEDASATSFEISVFGGSKSHFPRPFKLWYSQRRLF